VEEKRKGNKGGGSNLVLNFESIRQGRREGTGESEGKKEKKTKNRCGLVRLPLPGIPRGEKKGVRSASASRDLVPE